MDTATLNSLIAIDLSSEQSIRVGLASIDPVSREATFGGRSEKIQPQNLKVLVALARLRGKVVTRDQLVDLCWDGRFVGDDVINRAISTLRQFAERAGGFAIETVPRVGYRLTESSRPRQWRRGLIYAALAAVMGLSGLAFLEWPRDIPERPMPTIAVAAFTTASVDPQDRQLASDARDAVAHTLSQTEYRVSLADGAQDKSTASDFVVSGNVTGSLQKAVVTVRVEDLLHNVIVYSNRFETDRGNVAELPDRIGAQVTRSLSGEVSLLMIDRIHPSDPAITAELFGPWTNYQSARQIAARAPKSVIAQVVLAFDAADAIWDGPSDQQVETLEVGRHAMERVRKLAPELGDSDILWCFLHSRVRMIECEDHLRAGMRRDVDSAWVPTQLARWLKDVGRTNEALVLSRSALAHDPFVQDKIEMMLRMLEATGRQDEARVLYHDSRRWWPDDPTIFSGVVHGLMDRGDFEALTRLAKEVEGTGVASLIEPSLPVLAAIQAKDVARTRKLCPVGQAPSVMRDVCMLAFARLADNDSAFALASRIYPNRVGRTPEEEDMLWLHSSRYGETDILMGAAAAPLRRDSRYLALAQRTGLLRYWRSGRLPDFCQPPQPEPICSQLRSGA